METFLILCTIYHFNGAWSMKTLIDRFLTSSVQQCSTYHARNFGNGNHSFDTYRMPRDQFLLEQKCGIGFKDCPKVGEW